MSVTFAKVNPTAASHPEQSQQSGSRLKDLNRRSGTVNSHACNTSRPNRETVVQLRKTFIPQLRARQAMCAHRNSGYLSWHCMLAIPTDIGQYCAEFPTPVPRPAVRKTEIVSGTAMLKPRSWAEVLLR